MLTKPSSTNYLDHPMNREPPNLDKNNMRKSRSNPQPGIPPSLSPPPSPPNYMKSTSSFDAKKDSFKTLRKTTSFKSSRSSIKKSPSVLINRDTCSSTLKDSKFPAFLELNHGGDQLEGTSVFKVCHYTYCSLNGHHHRHNPPLPPLNRFITSKRRQILKTRCLSPPLATTAGDRPDELDIPSIDNDSDLSEEGLETELLNTHQTSNPDCLSPPPGIAVGDQPEKVDDLDTPNTDIKSELSEALEMEMEEGPEKEFLETHQTSHPDCLSPAPEIAAGDQPEKVDDLDNPNTDIESEQSEALNVEKPIEENDEVHGIDHLKIAKSERRGLEELDEEQKGFNPKQPNFLDVESEPETEKVDLRHQELDDKKNSEEWMLDYAIRQAVNKLGSARKKRVGLLVEAFEKVIPTHHQFEHRSMSASPVALNHSRPIIQACI